MRCPTCRRDLLVVEWRRIELDHCPACRGTWFDAGELDLLLAGCGDESGRGIEELLKLPAAASREERVRCPRCDRRMLKAAADDAPVFVDVCPAGDGFWFDRGEVGALAAALAARGTCAANRLAEHLGELFR